MRTIKRMLVLAGVVLIGAALSANFSPAWALSDGCPPGQVNMYACQAWFNECAPTWIKSCWCCVSPS